MSSFCKILLQTCLCILTRKKGTFLETNCFFDSVIFHLRTEKSMNFISEFNNICKDEFDKHLIIEDIISYMKLLYL